MRNEATIVVRRQPDGKLVEVLPDGQTRPLPNQTDWDRVRAKTDEEVFAAALSDRDAKPSTEDQIARMRPVPLARRLRRNTPKP